MVMKRLLSALAVLGLLVGSAHAGLLGTEMTANLTFGADPNNYFDPENGRVPGGYLNSNSIGTLVTVSNPEIEYGYSDGSNTITVNFTDTEIEISTTITNASLPSAGTYAMQFDNGANEFEYASGSVASFFINSLTPGSLGVMFTGVPIGIFIPPGGLVFTFREAVSDPSAVPEPATLALLGVGLAGIGFSRRKQ